jgi:hypothetical protein
VFRRRAINTSGPERHLRLYTCPVVYAEGFHEREDSDHNYCQSWLCYGGLPSYTFNSVSRGSSEINACNPALKALLSVRNESASSSERSITGTFPLFFWSPKQELNH